MTLQLVLRTYLKTCVYAWAEPDAMLMVSWLELHTIITFLDYQCCFEKNRLMLNRMRSNWCDS